MDRHPVGAEEAALWIGLLQQSPVACHRVEPTSKKTEYYTHRPAVYNDWAQVVALGVPGSATVLAQPVTAPAADGNTSTPGRLAAVQAVSGVPSYRVPSLYGERPSRWFLS